jgi:hypothetical protein
MMKYFLILIVIATAIVGCQPAEDESPLRMQRDEAVGRARAAEQQASDLAATNQALQEQLAAQVAGTPGDRKYAFTVESLEIASQSGGMDTDKKPGHDVVVVFLEPKDRDGATIKAAGTIRVQLFDLAAAEGKRLLAEKTIKPSQCSDAFSDSLLAYHYRIDLPLKSPVHTQLTIQAELVDVLTGKPHRAQKAIRIVPKPTPADAKPHN